MMLFRIEDTQGVNHNLREYNTENFNFPCINTKEFDFYIAQKIRDEINGSKKRTLLSYSKSLATCILKYNKYCDNDLHVYSDPYINYFSYLTPEKYRYLKDISHSQTNSEYYETFDSYSLERNSNFSDKEIYDTIYLCSFSIDVSNNQLVNNYLKYHTGTGKKLLSSPEKDSEVVVMNPLHDYIISSDGYLSSVYILYALHMKYRFLCDYRIMESLIYNLQSLDSRFFIDCLTERTTLIKIILYLSANWETEYNLSKKIYCFNNNCLPTYYDPISQFNDILQDDFEESYNQRSYNYNVVSDLIWDYCASYLGYQI